jgi:hypothetical protein
VRGEHVTQITERAERHLGSRRRDPCGASRDHRLAGSDQIHSVAAADRHAPAGCGDLEVALGRDPRRGLVVPLEHREHMRASLVVHDQDIVAKRGVKQAARGAAGFEFALPCADPQESARDPHHGGDLLRRVRDLRRQIVSHAAVLPPST